MVPCLGRAAGLEYGRILQRNDWSIILLATGQDSMGCLFLFNSFDGALHHIASTVRTVKYLCPGASSARPHVAQQKAQRARRSGDRIVNGCETDDVTLWLLVSRQAQWEGSGWFNPGRVDRCDSSYVDCWF